MINLLLLISANTNNGRKCIECMIRSTAGSQGTKYSRGQVVWQDKICRIRTRKHFSQGKWTRPETQLRLSWSQQQRVRKDRGRRTPSRVSPREACFRRSRHWSLINYPSNSSTKQLPTFPPDPLKNGSLQCEAGGWRRSLIDNQPHLTSCCIALEGVWH